MINLFNLFILALAAFDIWADLHAHLYRWLMLDIPLLILWIIYLRKVQTNGR